MNARKHAEKHVYTRLLYILTVAGLLFMVFLVVGFGFAYLSGKSGEAVGIMTGILAGTMFLFLIYLFHSNYGKLIISDSGILFKTAKNVGNIPWEKIEEIVYGKNIVVLGYDDAITYVNRPKILRSLRYFIQKNSLDVPVISLDQYMEREEFVDIYLSEEFRRE
jgi:hypothetical protein